MLDPSSVPINPVELATLGTELEDDDWLISTWEKSWLMDWAAGNVTQDPDGTVDLRLDASEDGGAPYKGAEIQSVSSATYGTWSWLAHVPDMEPGAVFGMFLYRADHNNDPWLEFDFEFVGGNTREVYLSVFMEDASGVRHSNIAPVIIDLGFDASQAAHLYQIEVVDGAAHFMVDGEVIYSFDASDMPGNLWNSGELKSFASLWSATPKLAGWAGEWNYGGTPLVAELDGLWTPDNPLVLPDNEGLGKPLRDETDRTTDDIDPDFSTLRTECDLDTFLF